MDVAVRQTYKFVNVILPFKLKKTLIFSGNGHTVIGIFQINFAHITVWSDQLQYSFNAVHFKMVVNHFLIEAFQVQYQPMTSICFRGDKYGGQKFHFISCTRNYNLFV